MLLDAAAGYGSRQISRYAGVITHCEILDRAGSILSRRILHIPDSLFFLNAAQAHPVHVRLKSRSVLFCQDLTQHLRIVFNKFPRQAECSHCFRRPSGHVRSDIEHKKIPSCATRSRHKTLIESAYPEILNAVCVIHTRSYIGITSLKIYTLIRSFAPLRMTQGFSSHSASPCSLLPC